MDEMIYNALCHYYTALQKLGYYKYEDVKKLLVLIFINELVYGDYRANLTEADYHAIEKALDCLYGTSCLIPYPEYLKMGRLYLGETTELAQRIKNLEDTEVLKPMAATQDDDSDIVITVEE